jgi:beta-lactamase regulating signal transducer with metallopeptidase domain
MNIPLVVPPELHWLCSATWQAAVLGALVLLVQTLGRNWLSPANRFVLWWLVLIRLCLPITPESAWSVFNLVPAQGTAFHSPQPTGLETTGRGTVMGDRASIELASEESIDVATVNAAGSKEMAGVGKSEEYQALRESVRSPWSWIIWLWLFGAVVYGARLLTASLLLGRDLRQRQPLRDNAVRTLLEDCRQRMGIRSQIELIETSKVQSPALFGLIRPRLLIPSGFLRAFTVTEIRHVLMHELAHLRRGDLLLNWLMVAIQAVYWFNPLVYLLFARIRSDRELACDALAMGCISEPDRNTYGQTVLKLVERLAVPIPAPGLVGVLEDCRSIERRVKSIIRFRPDRSRPWTTVVVCLFLGAFTLTDARTTSPTLVGVREGDSSETEAASTTIERSTHSAYTVAGHLEIHFPTWDAMQAGEFSPVRHVDEYAFTIASDGPRWTMRIRPVRVELPEPEDLPSGTRVFTFEVMAVSDGTEFAVTSIKPPGEFPPEAHMAAARGPGAEPFEVAQNISVIWYTYASHAALARNEDEMLVPMEFLDWRWGRTRGRVPGRFTLSDSTPHLPEQVVLHSYEVWGRLLDPDTARTNSLLQVNAFTNVHGLSIPLETTIEHRYVNWQRGSLHSHPFARFRLQTLSVEPSADLGEYPPPITGRHIVRDYRLSGISPSRQTTDGWD